MNTIALQRPSKTVISVKTDVSVRDRARELAKNIGIPLSTVVNAYLKDFIRNQSITLAATPILRQEVVKEIQQARVDYKKGVNISPKFNSMSEAVDWLNS